MIYHRQIPDITRKNLRKKGKEYMRTHQNKKYEEVVNISERYVEGNRRSKIGYW